LFIPIIGIQYCRTRHPPPAAITSAVSTSLRGAIAVGTTVPHNRAGVSSLLPHPRPVVQLQIRGIPGDRPIRSSRLIVNSSLDLESGKGESREAVTKISFNMKDGRMASRGTRSSLFITTRAGAEPVRFARSCGLLRGARIATRRTKFRAVARASADSVRKRQPLQLYLNSMESDDEEQQSTNDPSAGTAYRQKSDPSPGRLFAARFV
jgi:hypothetical protein